MDVLSDSTKHVAGKVKVDDVHDVFDIQTARRNAGSNQDGRFGGAESTAARLVSSIHFHENIQCILALTLGTISMDGRARQTHVVEVIVNQIRLALGVDENQSATGRHGHQQVKETLLLQRLIDIDNLEVSVQDKIGHQDLRSGQH